MYAYQIIPIWHKPDVNRVRRPGMYKIIGCEPCWETDRERQRGAKGRVRFNEAVNREDYRS